MQPVVDGGGVDTAGADAGHVIPGGSQLPLLQHVPPPSATNGSDPGQPVAAGGAVTGGVDVVVLGHDIPGGIQLPLLQHVPPPSATNGSGFAQAEGDVDGGGGGGADVVGDAHVIPGGSQLPLLQHVPPPSATKGSGVAQADGDGVGVGAGSGGGVGAGAAETSFQELAVPVGPTFPTASVQVDEAVTGPFAKPVRFSVVWK